MDVEILIKFGRREHMQALLDYGLVYMLPCSFFRKCEWTDEQRDDLEGLETVFQLAGSRLQQRNPETGALEEIALLTGGLGRVWNSHVDAVNIYCLTYLKATGTQPLQFAELLDPRLYSGFGDTAVVIYKAADFVTRVKTALQEFKYMHSQRPVDYVEMKHHNGEVGPFVKDVRWKHQREFRICALKKGVDSQALEVRIGSIRDLALLMPACEVARLSVVCDASETEA